MGIKYKRIFWCWMVGSVFLLATSTAWAVSLEFVPAMQTVQLGNPVMVDVVISGLTAGGDPSVGTFDLDVTYDPGILTATGVTFGTELGAGVFSFQDFNLFVGLVDLAEISFLGILSGQPASFTLATLSFNTVGTGTSALTFSQSLVGDALGFDLPHTSGTGSVTVENMPAVPEPGTILLFGTGLAGLAAWRVRKRQVR
ncbi:MAG: PEP-CTERM sorting domain-containing protein [Nitrospirota bacterium]|nr:PEP-CTERM sorting domain-containing protein [Nitrospirota bacterium]